MPKTVTQKDSIITTGAAGYVVSIGDTYIVEESVIVASGDGHAGILMVEDAHLILKGIAAGYVGIEDQIGGQLIEIEKTGTATGNPTGVFLKNNSFLNNAGHVAGNSAGVVIGGLDSDITNSGTIQANPRDGGAAIYMGVNAGGKHAIINSGLLTNSGGEGRAIDVDPYLDSVEFVTNSGKIVGGIALGEGNDKVNTKSGTVRGTIEMGDGKDTVFGSAGADSILGGAGNDSLEGGGKNDSIKGNNGADVIKGGAGRDLLAGNVASFLDDAAPDRFVFGSVAASGTTASTRDTIWGHFAGPGGDKIDLKAIDANGSASGNGKFSFIGSGDFHSNSTGEVQVRATGNVNEYLVRIDTDTDNKAEMSILVHSTSALTASDFIL